MNSVEKANAMVEAGEYLSIAAALLYKCGIKDACIATHTVLDIVMLDLAEHNEMHFPFVTGRRR